MFRVILEFPGSDWAGHDIQIVGFIAGHRSKGMVALRHQDDIAVFNADGFIQGAIVVVNPLERKALPGIQFVIIGFLQVGFMGR